MKNADLSLIIGHQRLLVHHVQSAVTTSCRWSRDSQERTKCPQGSPGALCPFLSIYTVSQKCTNFENV